MSFSVLKWFSVGWMCHWFFKLGICFYEFLHKIFSLVFRLFRNEGCKSSTPMHKFAQKPRQALVQQAVNSHNNSGLAVF